MRASLLAFLATMSLMGYAQDIQLNELPSQCRSACMAATSISVQCDRQDDNNNDDNDDQEFIDCVCGASDASTIFPNCEACVSEVETDDNDVRDIVTSCGFDFASTWSSLGSMSVTPTASTSSTSGTSTATAPTTTPTSDDNDDSDDSNDTTDDNDNSDDSSNSSDPPNAAPMITAAPLGGLAAAGIAIAGLL